MLRSSPFNLPWGSSVFAKIEAYNIYGSSIISDKGNGTKILTVPDAPNTLIEVYSARTKSSLGISWN